MGVTTGKRSRDATIGVIVFTAVDPMLEYTVDTNPYRLAVGKGFVAPLWNATVWSRDGDSALLPKHTKGQVEER